MQIFQLLRAYIADSSTSHARTKAFGMMGAVFGLVFIVGPLIGGVVGAFNLSLPFLMSGVLTVLILLFGRKYLSFMHNERNSK